MQDKVTFQGSTYLSLPYDSESRRSRWNPRSWGLKTKLAVAIAAIIILVVIIIGAVLGTRANRYPNYSQLRYTIKDTYSGTGFFTNFDYFTGYDPTSGFVHYCDSSYSAELNLTYATSSTAVLRVDTSETAATTGRKSARITSKNQYNDGLFIFDITHSPYGCGTWPAIWLSDTSNWPYHGEIDVIEAVNQATTGNQMTLHTSDGCSMNVKRKETGSVLTTNCYNGTDNNAGCGVQGPAASNGPVFNSNGGGVYAMEFRDAGIRTWFFPRSSIPSDIMEGSSPDPSSWGIALADFPGTDCNIASHFTNQSIIVDIDLCGSWAGATSVYTHMDACPGTCSDYVANNAAAFEQAYWSFNYFKVFSAS